MRHWTTKVGFIAHLKLLVLYDIVENLKVKTNEEYLLLGNK